MFELDEYINHQHIKYGADARDGVDVEDVLKVAASIIGKDGAGKLRGVRQYVKASVVREYGTSSVVWDGVAFFPLSAPEGGDVPRSVPDFVVDLLGVFYDAYSFVAGRHKHLTLEKKVLRGVGVGADVLASVITSTAVASFFEVGGDVLMLAVPTIVAGGSPTYVIAWYRRRFYFVSNALNGILWVAFGLKQILNSTVRLSFRYKVRYVYGEDEEGRRRPPKLMVSVCEVKGDEEVCSNEVRVR